MGEIIKSYGFTSSADRDTDHIYMLLQLRSGKSLYVGPLTNSDFDNAKAMTEEIYSTQKRGTDLNVASMAPVMGNNYSDEELNNFS
ncbi:MAG: hypothetical protein LUC37_02950 [Prevotella sp.]|nr:hypothetical protein [Prevotella sp.]